MSSNEENIGEYLIRQKHSLIVLGFGLIKSVLQFGFI